MVGELSGFAIGHVRKMENVPHRSRGGLVWLERHAEGGGDASGGDEVGASEGGEEVVEALGVGEVDDVEAGGHLPALFVPKVIVAERECVEVAGGDAGGAVVGVGGAFGGDAVAEGSEGLFVVTVGDALFERGEGGAAVEADGRLLGCGEAVGGVAGVDLSGD